MLRKEPEADSSAPQGPQSDKQRPEEHRDSVRNLPPQRAYGRTSPELLRRVWRELCGEEPSSDNKDVLSGVFQPPEKRVHDEEMGARRIAESLGIVTLPSGEEVYAPLIQKGRNRVMRLKGYGDAINAEVARVFIESVMETL
jgi:hypothetical protein